MASTASPIPDTALRRSAMSASLARNWGLVLIRGLLAIALGVLTLALPGVALASLLLVFAAYMFIDGVVAIVAGVRAARRHERWGWLIAEGVFGIAAGIAAVVLPLATVLALVALAAIWAIASGIMLVIAAFRLEPAHGRVLMALAGVVSIVWGGLLLFAPVAGALVLTIWIGAYALIFGISLIVLAIRLRGRHRVGAA